MVVIRYVFCLCTLEVFPLDLDELKYTSQKYVDT